MDSTSIGELFALASKISVITCSGSGLGGFESTRKPDAMARKGLRKANMTASIYVWARLEIDRVRQRPSRVQSRWACKPTGINALCFPYICPHLSSLRSLEA